jgi:hypothetical protein
VLTFTIDRNNHIRALTSTPQAQVNLEAARFTDARDLDRLAKRWPGSRLVEIWNALPRQKPVKKFTNRKVALSRIWAAAQSLAPDQSPLGLRLITGKAAVGKRLRKTQKAVHSRQAWENRPGSGTAATKATHFHHSMASPQRPRLP